MKKVPFKTENSIGHYEISDNEELIIQHDEEPIEIPIGAESKPEIGDEDIPILAEILKRDYAEDQNPDDQEEPVEIPTFNK